MALQDDFDDEDWGNWGNNHAATIIEQIPVNDEDLTSWQTGNDNASGSPDKENKWGNESQTAKSKWDDDSKPSYTKRTDGDSRRGFSDPRKNDYQTNNKYGRNDDYNKDYNRNRNYDRNCDRGYHNGDNDERKNKDFGNRNYKNRFNERDFNDRDNGKGNNNERFNERRNYNDRDNEKRDFNERGRVDDRRDFGGRGDDRQDFGSHGDDRRDFGGRRDDKRDFGDRVNDKRDFGGRGDRREFGGLDADRRDFGGRDAERRDFGGRDAERRDFGGRDDERRDFGGRDDERRDFGGRDAERRDFVGRPDDRRDIGDRDVDRRDYGNRGNDRKDFNDRRPYNDRDNDYNNKERRPYNDRDVERSYNDKIDGRRTYVDRDAERSTFNDRDKERRLYNDRDNNNDRNESRSRWDDGEDNKYKTNRSNFDDYDMADKFQNNVNMNDHSNPRTFQNENKDADKGNNNEEPPIVKRATYIPNDDEQDYELHVNSGINFDNYEKIPVEVTGEDIVKPIEKFSDFDMPDFLKNNIESMKYNKLTPVQKYAIPIISADRDLMACAQTGSGKTAAFLLPIIVSLYQNRVDTEVSNSQVAFPKALIMAPTRELCRQIFTAARQLCQGSELKCAYIYGGIEMNKSRRNLQSSGCDILVATPGRLIHFLELVWVSLRYLKYFVLDEGDRMMDKDGFYESVNKISEEANFTGDDRKIQISMFSATFPNEIQDLAKNILKNYLFLVVGMVGSANSDVRQEVIRADQKEKMNLAIDYIKDIPNEKTLIFVQSKRIADFLGIKLGYLGYKATTIHGDREQEQREMALNDFKSGRVNFMVATNVAARGLDIPKVDTVINIDMPDDIDTYVHRIGRTGRCGNVGRAVSYFDENNDIALAGQLVHRLQEANQEIPDWLVSLSDNTGTRRQPHFIKDNRSDMKVSKFVETSNDNFMKGSNADYEDNDDEQSEWLKD